MFSWVTFPSDIIISLPGLRAGRGWKGLARGDCCWRWIFSCQGRDWGVVYPRLEREEDQPSHVRHLLSQQLQEDEWGQVRAGLGGTQPNFQYLRLGGGTGQILFRLLIQPANPGRHKKKLKLTHLYYLSLCINQSTVFLWTKRSTKIIK